MIKRHELNTELSKIQVDLIFTKLKIAEKNGFTCDTKDSILAESKVLLRNM